jgi:hypothetical protein
MITPEGVARLLHLSSREDTRAAAAAIKQYGERLSLRGIYPIGLFAQVASEKLPLLSPEYGKVGMTLMPESSSYTLDLKVSRDESPVLLARIRGGGIPDAILGEAAVNDSYLRGFVLEVMTFLAEQVNLEGVR